MKRPVDTARRPLTRRRQAEAQDLLNSPGELMRTVSESFTVADWIAANPRKAGKVLASAFLTSASSVTHDWLMDLCKAEGFKPPSKRRKR